MRILTITITIETDNGDGQPVVRCTTTDSPPPADQVASRGEQDRTLEGAQRYLDGVVPSAPSRTPPLDAGSGPSPGDPVPIGRSVADVARKLSGPTAHESPPVADAGRPAPATAGGDPQRLAAMKALADLGVNDAVDLVRTYSVERILEVCHAAATWPKPLTNPAGWVVRALRCNWTVTKARG